jgi:hypothetical protein
LIFLSLLVVQVAVQQSHLLLIQAAQALALVVTELLLAQQVAAVQQSLPMQLL